MLRMAYNKLKVFDTILLRIRFLPKFLSRMGSVIRRIDEGRVLNKYLKNILKALGFHSFGVQTSCVTLELRIPPNFNRIRANFLDL